MFFPRTEVEWYQTIPEAERPHNVVRRELMDRFGMCHCRCHSNWDPIVTHGIADACASQLEFPEPVYRSRYLRLYELAPQTLGELALHCKARLGTPHVRVTGDRARVVSKVGIAYGGFGQTWECLDEYLIQGAEAVIIGEGIDYTFRAALDAGLGLIETSHVGSENPGMREFARLLAERLEGLPVRFVDSGYPWVMM
jgi:putative NIF3 family GTP cyclohydrolase 1 type 2